MVEWQSSISALAIHGPRLRLSAIQIAAPWFKRDAELAALFAATDDRRHREDLPQDA